MSGYGRRFRPGPCRFQYTRAKGYLLTVLHSLFSGFLSGLQAQSDISELLDEIYYDGLS
jgi:LDH2 family malate/lactate/ureidoglycolate dehydrogenase